MKTDFIERHSLAVFYEQRAVVCCNIHARIRAVLSMKMVYMQYRVAGLYEKKFKTSGKLRLHFFRKFFVLLLEVFMKDNLHVCVLGVEPCDRFF